MFDSTVDINELNNLADQHAERVAELVDTGRSGLTNQVFPIDEGTL